MNLQRNFENAKYVTKFLSELSDEKIASILVQLADELLKEQSYIIEENQKDLLLMDPEDPKFDRLKLTENRIAAISKDLVNVAKLKSPLRKVLMEKTLLNGLNLKKVSVPLGVVGVIYEARPNVTIDVFSLCIKTGNVAILKGGSDAYFTNQALISMVHYILELNYVSKFIVRLLPPERSSTEALLNAVGLVDVIIPRGSNSLIKYVREHSKVPVIETGAGIVHTFVDETADIKKSQAIIFNAKTRRVSVCNSLDCLIVHEQKLNDLPFLTEPLSSANVIIYADEQSFEALKDHYPTHLLFPAKEEHFGIEFLDYKLSIKTVTDLESALDHIAKYSSKHSEAILSENEENINRFLSRVDAAAVYANASTGFTDGAQFGLGAEIGISTQKLHARGPMGLEELTSYKWIIVGTGQIRN
ncbi:Gamma-glutamyl phosphate reductase [Arcticibacter svalbardensis MN12-7]|uniref:Gamma-glutamyl phosphate reductase n=1 Tax=Arcticibacter svalbardensis MN12-7 TaxID=1150600 RepID=R9GPD8_9SPHI|nr:glutamate-5-semialdehyde dehydrogenase [Arcticibacter svalbardensis]EOR93682.1 Gamma-glutamyl phosphate reductase [Arcticibacter svalbardensis MN12-7]